MALQIFFCMDLIAEANDFCKKNKSLNPSYQADCELLEQFSIAKSCLAQKNINIDNIRIYRALRLLDRKDYNKNVIKNKDTWEAYKPSATTWTAWEATNFFNKQLQNRIMEKATAQLEQHATAQKKSVSFWRKLLNRGSPVVENPVVPRVASWQLTLDDIQNLHRSVMNSEILGFNRIQSLIGLKPKVGFFRTKAHTTPYFTAKMTQAEFHDLLEDELVTSETIQVKKGPLNGLFGNKTISYLPSQKVEEAMQGLVTEVNQTMSDYLQCSQTVAERPTCPDQSPIEFALSVQRKFVGIHPFHEGCGRLSRQLQELILNSLGFPYLPTGDLQNDILTPQKNYVKLGRTKLKTMVDALQHCCDNPNNLDCQVLYNQREAKQQTMKSTISKFVLLHHTKDCGLLNARNPLHDSTAVVNYAEQSAQQVLKRFQREFTHQPQPQKRRWTPFARLSQFMTLGSATAGAHSELDQSPDYEVQFKDEAEKIDFINKLLEHAAEPLLGKHCQDGMTFDAYNWSVRHPFVPNLLKNAFVYNTRLFNHTLAKPTQEEKLFALYGNGGYISRNVLDSFEYSLESPEVVSNPQAVVSKIQAMLSKAQATSLEWMRSNQSLSALTRIEFNCHAKILSANHTGQLIPYIKKITGLDFKDYHFKISPNIIFNYSPESNPDSAVSWMNNMLHQSNLMRSAFKARRLPLKDLSLPDLNALLKKVKSENPEIVKKSPRAVLMARRDLTFAIADKKARIHSWLLKFNRLDPVRLEKKSTSLRLPTDTQGILDCLSEADQHKYAHLFDAGQPIQWVWSKQNTCIPVSKTGVIIQHEFDLDQWNLAEEQDPDLGYQQIFGNPCIKKEQAEKALPQLLHQVYDATLDRRSDRYALLHRILSKETPFVTPARKCAIIVNTTSKIPGQLLYIDKKFCARQNPDYQGFLENFNL